jgi:hypothetical protein
MTKPIIVDLPHSLGVEEAKRRLRGGIGRLKDYIPGPSADVRSDWEGDRMNLAVTAMGQSVNSRIDVQERIVRVEVILPGLLGMFAGKIEAMLRRQGADMLEDKRKA